MIKLCLALMLILLPGGLFAQTLVEPDPRAWSGPTAMEWIHITDSENIDGRVHLYADKGHAIRHGDQVTIWTLEIVEGGWLRRFWPGPGPMPPVAAVKALIVIDCNRRTLKNKTVYLFDSRGGLISEYRPREKVTAPPDSTGAAFIEYFCEQGHPMTQQSPTLKHAR